MKIKLYLSAAIIILLLVGCVPKKVKISDERNLSITPITTPTKFTLGPSKRKTLTIEASTLLDAKNTVAFFVEAGLEIEKTDKKNQFNTIMEINRIKTDGKDLSFDLPIVTGAFISDEFGRVSEVRVGSPLLKSVGKDPGPGSDLYRSIEQYAKKSLNTFRDKKIVTGDTFFYLNPKCMTPIILKTSTVGPELLGYATLDGQKVVVARIDKKDVPAVINGTDITVDLSGYYIFNPENMMQKYGKLKVDLWSPKTNEHIQSDTVITVN